MNHFRLRAEKARYERDEAADLERKLAPVKQELAKTLTRADKMTRLYWSMPLTQLAKNVNEGRFEPDHGVQFPTTNESQSGERGREQFQTFFCDTLPPSGWVASDVAKQRVLLFCLAQAFSENHADLANPLTWETAWLRLLNLECFDVAAGEIGYSESQRVVEPVIDAPAPEPTVDDLERINTSTREGTKIAHQILSRAIFDGEAKEVYLGWLRSLVNNFGYEMPEDVQRQVIDYFLAGRRSWLDKKAYDDCRLNFCKRGIMPPTCLTESDIANASIEDADTQTWQGRRNLKLELAASRLRTN